MNIKLVLLLFCVVGSLNNGSLAEHMCSKFDYEIKTLEAMLRIEQRVEKMIEDMKQIQETVSKELLEIQEFRSKTTEELDKTMETFVKEQKELLLGSAIAFSVGNPSASLTNGIPTFTNEITNVGGAFNKDTGVFTCPIDGVYMFSVTIASQSGWDMFCSIQRNDDGSDHVIVRSYSDNSYTTVSNMVYFELAKGDTVNLGGCSGFGAVLAYSNMFTFSGALIRLT